MMLMCCCARRDGAAHVDAVDTPYTPAAVIDFVFECMVMSPILQYTISNCKPNTPGICPPQASRKGSNIHTRLLMPCCSFPLSLLLPLLLLGCYCMYRTCAS